MFIILLTVERVNSKGQSFTFKTTFFPFSITHTVSIPVDSSGGATDLPKPRKLVELLVSQLSAAYMCIPTPSPQSCFSPCLSSMTLLPIFSSLNLTNFSSKLWIITGASLLILSKDNPCKWSGCIWDTYIKSMSCNILSSICNGG